MLLKTLRHLSILATLFVVPAILPAGANTWTGNSPTATGEAPTLVAADPGNPYVVYGALRGTLYRSRDGGRSWIELRAFYDIKAILVHPASPSTIYVAGYDSTLEVNPYAIHKSTDAGETWTRVLDHVFVSVLAGSPTDASTVFAGESEKIYMTTDGGATWHTAGLSGVIGSLVINPREPAVAYAGGEGYDYWGITPGSLFKTTDGGVTWGDTAPEALESTTAMAVDPAAPSTVYAAVGPYKWSDSSTPVNVLRSEDGGLSWVSAGKGLPGSTIRGLVTDPRVSGTLYAGTGAGVFRSRDGGRIWTPYGQQLAGMPIHSLAIDDDGRFLHAGTNRGIFDLEIASGPLDVAPGASGASRLLSWNAERLSVATLDSNGRWTSGPLGDPSAIWTAIAIATERDGGDGTHVLWQCGDGRSAIEIVGPTGRQSVKVFAAEPGWIASDLSVPADGATSVLWTSRDGRMRIARVDASGAATLGPEYGPAVGWSAIAIADGSDGQTRVLWRSIDGRASLSLHRQGAMLSSFQWPAHPSWTVEDIAMGADGRARLLRISPGRTAEVSVVEAGGALTSAAIYRSPGLTPRAIAAGADGLTRLLFSGAGGVGDLVVLGSDNALRARYAIPAAGE